MSKRKEDQPETNDGADDVTDEPPAKKSRGRPRIHPPKDPNAPKRPRGRPPKADTGDKPATKPKAKKAGKTTVRKSTTPGKRGRGRPKGSTNKTKKAQARGRPPKAAAQAEAEPPAEDAGEGAESS